MSASTSSSSGLKQTEQIEDNDWTGRTSSSLSNRSNQTSGRVLDLCDGPAVGPVLREHPQDEASPAVRFEGGRDDGVLSGRQFEAVAHLPQVDEVLTASHSRPPQQDLRAQPDVTTTFILTTEEEKAERVRSGRSEGQSPSCCPLVLDY